MAFLAGVKAAVTAPMAPPPPPPTWHTRLSQHSEPAECSHCLYAFCCPQCTSAAAKSKADKSHPCYNFLCWTPIGAYSWVRMGYGIPGVCGDDICYGMWCMPCTIRQMYTESLLRGPNNQPPTQGANVNAWKSSLFDCTPCELFNATFCPCCVVNDIRKRIQPEAGKSCWFDAMCVLPTAMYGQVRHSYGIVTDFPVCEDVLVPFFCMPCALNQALKMTKWVQANGLPTAAQPLAAPMGHQQQGQYGQQPQYGGQPQYQQHRY